MESKSPNEMQKRQSLRDSVLKQPLDRGPIRTPPDYENDRPHYNPGNGFFGGIGDFFGDKFSPFGFGSFGNMDHLEERLHDEMARLEEQFNEKMSRFFSDFPPESFEDSQYYHQDRDLDEDISRKGLDRVLKRTPPPREPHQFFGGFSHSESTRTMPDGSVEKRVTHRNSNGETTTTVTITSPDGREVSKHDFDETYPKGSLYGGDSRLLPPDNPDGFFRSIFDNLKRFF